MVSNVRSVLLTIRKCVREIVREKTDAIPVQIYLEVIAFDEIYIFRRASVDAEGYGPWRKHLIPKDSLQEYNDRNLSQ